MQRQRLPASISRISISEGAGFSSTPVVIRVRPDGDSAVLLAEFRTWLDRERGLSPVSVRCYSKQSKAFLAWIGGAGAVSGLDAGKVTAFMVDWTAGRNTWTAKAMVTSLRAFLRFIIDRDIATARLMDELRQLPRPARVS